MDEIEIIGTFESEETSREVARALNMWFSWVMEGDPEDVPEVFEDLGISTEDYALEKDSDTDWEEMPRARHSGANVIISAETSETIDLLSELVESLGALDVSLAGEDEDDLD